MKTRHLREELFARRMVAARRALRLSQQALADGAGVHRFVITGIETGKRGVGLGEAADIAAALGTTVDQILADRFVVSVTHVVEVETEVEVA